MAKAQVELSRELGLFDITMIGVGAMIGAGIFVLTGIAAGAAGPALILAFALNGIITLFTAMTYAELGSAIPEAGGGYLWVKEGLPGPNAFLAGWMSWFAHAVAGSLYALGFGSHLALVLRDLGVPLDWISPAWLHKGLAALIILLFLYINYRGASETGAAGNVVTVLKIVVLLIFIASGLWAIARHPDYLQKFQDFAPNGLVGVISAMGLTFIAFEGYEIIVQAGEEVINPRRNIPKAVFLSLAIVIPIYMLVAFVALGAVNPDTDIPTYQWLAEHAELGVAEAARQFMPLGTTLLVIGAILSTMSALNATTYSSTRVSFAMGRDRNLPDTFAEVHPRTRTPHKALFWSGVLITFMAMAIPIEDVATAADIMFLLLFLQVNLAVITIRRKYGDRLKYGYLMPFFPAIPIIVIIFKLFLAVFLFNYSPIAWYFALAWLGVGLVIFYAYAEPRSREATPVIAETKLIPEPYDRERYRVLVPIANPESLPGLLQPAVNAARMHDGAITLLHVITVPVQTPLAAGRDYIERSKPLVDRALEMLEDAEVPVEVVIRIAHQLDHAIVQTALERDANLLIMGWRGESRAPDTQVGRHIDRIIDQVNCRVLVVQQALHAPPKSILIPISDPAQIRFALDAVGILTGEQTAHKEILYVFPHDATPSDRARVERRIQEQIAEFEKKHPKYRGTVTHRLATAADPVDVIAEAARNHDYVIVGASPLGWLQRSFFDSLPTRIARRVDCPVALVRPRTNPLGFGLHRVIAYVQGGYRRIDITSQQDLIDLGILEPEAEPNPHPLQPSVARLPVLVLGALALASVAAMYVGYGSALTWAGAVGFLVALWAFTWLSVRAAG